MSLEKVLGDPFDDDDPLSFRAVLDADEEGRLPAAGEEALSGWQLCAELVPRRLGGRWAGTDELARRARSVFRRDAALGVSHVAAPLSAVVPVWASGSAEQQARLTSGLLAGRRPSTEFPEVTECVDAKQDGPGFVLNGNHAMVCDSDRADSWLVTAGTDDGPTVFLLHQEELPSGAHHQARCATSGLRGCSFGGIEFRDCPVDADAVVGEPGDGVSLSQPVTDIVVPSMVLGTLDSALHVVHGFITGRRLYGHVVSDLPHARATLAGAFADLLIADCLATAAARSLHLAPHAAGLTASAVKHVVPLILDDAMYDLSIVLGARFYIREGPHAVFGKSYRDLSVLSAGTGDLTRLASLLPTTASSWSTGPHPELFGSDPLPEPDFAAFGTEITAIDPLTATLPAAVDELTEAAAARELTDLLVNELRSLSDTAVDPGADRYDLARRYPLLLAAAACVRAWLAHRSAGGFLGDPAWLEAALTRLAARLGRRPEPLPEPVAESMFAELRDRIDRRRSCCLDASPIFGTDEEENR
jgi:alkylation response protein AidB-like acyl-CoA dehydrogenase